MNAGGTGTSRMQRRVETTGGCRAYRTPRAPPQTLPATHNVFEKAAGAVRQRRNPSPCVRVPNTHPPTHASSLPPTHPSHAIPPALPFTQAHTFRGLRKVYLGQPVHLARLHELNMDAIPRRGPVSVAPGLSEVAVHRICG